MPKYQKRLHRVNFEDVSIMTTVNKTHFTVGEVVDGEVEVKANKEDSDLGYLYMYLKSECAKNPKLPLERTEVKIDKFVVGQPFHISAGQTIYIPFSFTIPFHTPITYRSVKVFIHTGLDLHAGDDPEDTDYIEIGPSPLQEKVFQSIELLKFVQQKPKYIPTAIEGEYLQIFEFTKKKFIL